MATTAPAQQAQAPQALTRAADGTIVWPEPALYVPKPSRVLVRTTRDGSGERKLSQQELAWIDAMVSGAYGVPAEAARCAGYADPAAMGQKLKRRLGQLVDQERDAREKAKVGSVSELIGLMWKYARGGRRVGYANARSAQDTLAKINGVLTDKVDLRLDRETLRREALAIVPDVPRLVVDGLRADVELVPNEPE